MALANFILTSDTLDTKGEVRRRDIIQYNDQKWELHRRCNGQRARLKSGRS